MSKNSLHRRQFLASLAATAAGLGLADAPLSFGKPRTRFPNPVGYATIAWPKDELDQALTEISKLGFKGVELGNWIEQKYEGPQLRVLRRQLDHLNLRPVSTYTFPVDPLSRTSQEEVRTLVAYARFLHDLGGLYLSVDDGLQPSQASDQSAVKALGERLTLLGKVTHEHGLGFGYHPHVGSLGQSWKGFGSVLKLTNPRYVGLIADLAHLLLGGSDPAEVIRTYHDRLLYLHFKDARKDAERVARKNPSLLHTVKYWFCEVGTGVVNFPAVMRAIRDVGFRGWIIIELDRYQPVPGGPDAAAHANKKAVERLGLKV